MQEFSDMGFIVDVSVVLVRSILGGYEGAG